MMIVDMEMQWDNMAMAIVMAMAMQIVMVHVIPMEAQIASMVQHLRSCDCACAPRRLMAPTHNKTGGDRSRGRDDDIVFFDPQFSDCNVSEDLSDNAAASTTPLAPGVTFVAQRIACADITRCLRIGPARHNYVNHQQEPDFYVCVKGSESPHPNHKLHLAQTTFGRDPYMRCVATER